MTINWSELTQKDTFDEALEMIKTMYQGGMSSFEIADRISRPGYTVTAGSVRTLLKAAGVEIRPHGGRHKPEVEFLQEDLEELTYKQLAVKYQVSTWTVWKKIKKK